MSRITYETLPFDFGVLHFGDQNLTGGLNVTGPGEAFPVRAREAAEFFARGDFAATGRFLDEHFTDLQLSLHSVFKDEQRAIVRTILDPVLSEAEGSYRHLYEEHISLIRFLTSLQFPLPHRLSMAAEVALELELGRALNYETFDPARIRNLLNEARLAGVRFQPERLALTAKQTIERLGREFEAAPEDNAILELFLDTAALLSELPFSVDTGRVQAIVFRTAEQVADEIGRARLRGLCETLRVRVV